MSETAFTVGPPLGGSQASARSDAEDQFVALTGRDVWFDLAAAVPDYVVTAAGDWQIVEGYEALRQSLLRRLITNPGEWTTKPDYGCGARSYVKAKNTPAMRAELAARIKGQFLQDTRVEKIVAIVVEPTPDGPGLVIRILVQPRARLRDSDTVPVNIQINS